MNYFLDTEFLEGKQNKSFLGIKYGETPPTIDLISIGIVSENSREYYAISKDFNLKEAWNRFQLEQQSGDMRNVFPEGKKVYSIRDNVLKPIYLELITKENNMDYVNCPLYKGDDFKLGKLEYKQLVYLIDKYGKTNKQIAEDIQCFTSILKKEYYVKERKYKIAENRIMRIPDNTTLKQILEDYEKLDKTISFYGYYCDYDWVVFCWLFGKMIDLPKSFPMYCNDLKQTQDKKFSKLNKYQILDIKDGKVLTESGVHYPKQTNEHNALSDAKWNKELYEFLNNL